MRKVRVKSPSTRPIAKRVAPTGVEQLALDIRSPRAISLNKPRAILSGRKPVAARAFDMDQILNSVDIERVTGRHRCTVYRWMAEGRFPAKVVREGRPIGWLRSDVERWLHGPSYCVPVVSLAQAVPLAESATS